LHGTWGGIIAGVLFILPSFFVLVVLAWIYMAYGSLPAVAGMLYGFKPAVVAIVLFAAYRIGTRVLKNVPSWSIAVLAFVAIFALKAPFPAIVFAAGLIGYFRGRLYPDHFKATAGHGIERTSLSVWKKALLFRPVPYRMVL
jgi:chromate transporter